MNPQKGCGHPGQPWGGGEKNGAPKLKPRKLPGKPPMETRAKEKVRPQKSEGEETTLRRNTALSKREWPFGERGKFQGEETHRKAWEHPTSGKSETPQISPKGSKKPINQGPSWFPQRWGPKE